MNWKSTVSAAEQSAQYERLRALCLNAVRLQHAGQTFAAVAEDMKRLGLELRGGA